MNAPIGTGLRPVVRTARLVEKFDGGLVLSPAATPIADSLEWTCEAWLGVLDALEAIHSMGFVHMVFPYRTFWLSPHIKSC